MWLSIASALISALASIAKYFTDKQLLDAGMSQKEKQQLEQALGDVEKAMLAIDNLDNDLRKRLRERYRNDEELLNHRAA